MDRRREPTDPELVDALTLSQQLGMLGSRPIHDVIEQSVAFVDALADVTRPDGPVVDVGSGGGVPGLIIGWLRPDIDLYLVERRSTRADHLRRLVLRLGLDAHVSTSELRELQSELSARCAAVVARGLAAPTVWLRDASRLLAPAGRIIVTEPPQSSRSPDRWPPEVLDAAGLKWSDHVDARIAVLQRST